MDFIGNKKAVSILESAIGKNRIAQAYLFFGPEGVGKYALAESFARSLILGRSGIFGPGDGKDGFLPDLTTVEPELEIKKKKIREKAIPIEKIRDIQKNLSLYPHGGLKKIVIIRNAHRLTRGAQNALLKTLEEPNGTSVVILVTHDEKNILETVRSRCQTVSFGLVASDEMEKLISSRGVGTETEEIARLSMGRPGLALKMLDDKEEMAFGKKALEDMETLGDLAVSQRFDLAERLARDNREAVREMEFWMGYFHEKARQETETAKISALFGKIASIRECIRSIRETNANSRLLIENLLLEI